MALRSQKLLRDIFRCRCKVLEITCCKEYHRGRLKTDLEPFIKKFLYTTGYLVYLVGYMHWLKNRKFLGVFSFMIAAVEAKPVVNWPESREVTTILREQGSNHHFAAIQCYQNTVSVCRHQIQNTFPLRNQRPLIRVTVSLSFNYRIAPETRDAFFPRSASL